MCDQNGIKTVAEEMSEQALECNKMKLESEVQWRKEYGGGIDDSENRKREEELERYKAILDNCEEGMSIPQSAAKPPRKHLFCDPDWEERKERKIRYVGHLRNKMDDSSHRH